MNGHACAGGNPPHAARAAPPTASTNPIIAKPTRRSWMACASEFQTACSMAAKSTASTIEDVTRRLLGSGSLGERRQRSPQGFYPVRCGSPRCPGAARTGPAALIVDPRRTTGGTLDASDSTLHRDAGVTE